MPTAKKTTPARAKTPQTSILEPIEPTAPVAPIEPVVEVVPEAADPPAPVVEDQPVGTVASAAEPIEPAAPVAPIEPVVASSAAPERVRLGAVSGLLRRMPLVDVLVHLEAFEDRIATLKSSQAVLDLQKRMRGTEGRNAPIYFSGDVDDEDGELDHLIAGIESVAAAQLLGLDSVFVVTVRPGDVGAVQSHLAAVTNTAPAPTEDDLLWLYPLPAV